MIDLNEYVDIPGFEGFYQMNRLGVIRGLDRYIDFNGGKRFIPGQIIKTRLNGTFYPAVNLTRNGKSKHIVIHVWLAKLFIPNPNNYPFVRHLNDIRDDNRLENLAWGTPADNAADSMRNGTFKSVVKFGENHHAFGKGHLSRWYGKKGEESENARIILDTQTGIYYFGLREAGEAKNINPQTLSGQLKGRVKNRTSLIYV